MDVGLRAYGLRNPSFAVPLLREGLHIRQSHVAMDTLALPWRIRGCLP